MRRRVAGATAAKPSLPGLLVSYTTLELGTVKYGYCAHEGPKDESQDVSGGCDWRQESGRGISKERAKSLLSQVGRVIAEK